MSSTKDTPQSGRPGARLDRRGFLKVLGGVGAAAALAGCRRLPVEHAVPYLIPPEEVTPGIPTLYASTCTACPAACGLMVTTRAGRPVKLEGHPDHPLSRGGLCALGQGHLRGLYDPGRLRRPTWDGSPIGWAALDDKIRGALREIRAAGKGVAVLASTIVSPTGREAVASFLAPYEGRLVELDRDLSGSAAVRDAYEALHGEPLLPWPRPQEADLLLVLGADPLGTGRSPVPFAADYAARRAASPQRGALRHIQIEGTLSLSGAAADERIAAGTADRRALLLLALESVESAPGWREAPEVPEAARRRWQERARGLAEAMRTHRGRVLVMSGSSDPAEQLAVALLNRIFGAEGATLDLDAPLLGLRGSPRDLDRLLADLEGGELGALIVLDADPVEVLPDGERFARHLRSLDLSVCIGERPTATSAACTAVAAAHHGLEQWNDLEPRRGLRTLAQPAVRPLFDTRHPFEGFLHWARAETRDWRSHLRAAWLERMGAAGALPGAWSRAVSRAGLPTASGSRENAGSPAAAAAREAASHPWRRLARTAPPAERAAYELELIAEVGRRDGRHAHIPWLRELPDPITRASWFPCARVAPATARELGVRDGDVIEIRRREVAIRLPARILPGQAPGVLGVPIGYGGPGEPQWAQAVPWRLSLYREGGIRVRGIPVEASATGERRELPLVQETLDSHGRPIIHQVTGYDGPVHGAHHPDVPDLWPDHPVSSPHWEMTIDLDACTGCSACVIACQAENNLAVVGPDEMRRHRDMHWLRIDRYFEGADENPDILFEPMLCHHCDDAPCETVCPVSATVHSQDGLNMQAYNRCVGTRYCANNCPYKVRRFNWFDNTEDLEPLERLVLNPDVVVRDRGVMEKCTFCVQRIQLHRIEGRKAGGSLGAGDWIDRVQTACQQSCPTHAIRFGDGADPESPVSAAKSDPRSFQVLGELGVEPSVSYLARVRHREGLAREPSGHGSGGGGAHDADGGHA